jgi:hypothetical protein
MFSIPFSTASIDEAKGPCAKRITDYQNPNKLHIPSLVTSVTSSHFLAIQTTILFITLQKSHRIIEAVDIDKIFN